MWQYSPDYQTPKPKAEVVSISEVFPATYFRKERISGTGGVVHHLSVALDGEVGGQSSSLHGALGQAMADEVHGMARRHLASVVADDGHAVADAIVAPGVCAKVAPAPAFVDVAVGADHKAEHIRRFVSMFVRVQTI